MEIWVWVTEEDWSDKENTYNIRCITNNSYWQSEHFQWVQIQEHIAIPWHHYRNNRNFPLLFCRTNLRQNYIFGITTYHIHWPMQKIWLCTVFVTPRAVTAKINCEIRNLSALKTKPSYCVNNLCGGTEIYKGFLENKFW